MSGVFYGKADKSETFEMLSYAADRGVTFWCVCSEPASCSCATML
jgi:hypothetical protein